MKQEIKNTVSFWTAESKKVTIAIIFLLTVVIDKVLLNDVIYGTGDLFESKVFRGAVFTLAVILTHDLQSILNNFVKNKIGGEK